MSERLLDRALTALAVGTGAILGAADALLDAGFPEAAAKLRNAGESLEQERGAIWAERRVVTKHSLQTEPK